MFSLMNLLEIFLGNYWSSTSCFLEDFSPDDRILLQELSFFLLACLIFFGFCIVCSVTSWFFLLIAF